MLTPKEIVSALDKYIVGQDKAKKAVAIALRNRYRRSKLEPELREEITPKNIIMIGPTGVGKTEIARRLAKLVDAPFIKIEATKFTEVGYVGRDVDSMIRDLVEESVRICKAKRMEDVKMMAEAATEQRLVKLLVPLSKQAPAPVQNPLQMLLGTGSSPQEPVLSDDEKAAHKSKQEKVLDDLRKGLLENKIVEIEVPQSQQGSNSMLAMGIDINVNEMFGGLLPAKHKMRKLPVSEARRVIFQEEADKLIDMDDVIREALIKAEQDGIIFIDEIDKIAGQNRGSGPDVSREGVQRDILPIIEGSTVSTKYGPIKTDFILFIAAGAFHVSKISDLIPELQGRFPIKVELKPLSVADYKQILIQPENAVTKQYAALLKADNISLQYTEEALTEISKYAYIANETQENIGARRLHTILELLLEDISFNAGGDHPVIEVSIDGEYVNEHLNNDFKQEDLQRFIL